MIEGVVGVIIWTEDLERLVRFYRDTLGLDPDFVREDFAAFKFGNMRLNLGFHSEVRGPTRDPYRVMINLGATDIHGITRRLRDQGVEFVRLPEQEKWGGFVATFQDPDGNLLQLLQAADPGV